MRDAFIALRLAWRSICLHLSPPWRLVSVGSSRRSTGGGGFLVVLVVLAGGRLGLLGGLLRGGTAFDRLGLHDDWRGFDEPVDHVNDSLLSARSGDIRDDGFGAIVVHGVAVALVALVLAVPERAAGEEAVVVHPVLLTLAPTLLDGAPKLVGAWGINTVVVQQNLPRLIKLQKKRKGKEGVSGFATSLSFDLFCWDVPVKLTYLVENWDREEEVRVKRRRSREACVGCGRT